MGKQAEIWLLQDYPSKRLHRLALDSLTKSFFNRHQINTGDSLVKNKFQLNTKSLHDRLSQHYYKLASPIADFEKGYLLIKNFEEKIFNTLISKSMLRDLEKLKLSLAFSTNFRTISEWLTFRALQKIGIPTVTHILSFDNLTSAGYRPWSKFDHYMTWSELMTKELIEFYNISKSKITITGTPQFDYHILPKFQWDLQHTLSELGLVSNQEYFLYCANHQSLTPRESENLAFIIENTRKIQNGKDIKWVLRLHPFDNFARWQNLIQTYPEVTLSLPWASSQSLQNIWASPGLYEMALLTNSIRYATVVFSMTSSIALDCAVLDRPFVNIGFHVDRESKEHDFYNNICHCHHYEPINASGAAPTANDISELIEFVEEAILLPGKRRQERVAVRDLICGQVDGEAGKRIVNVIDQSFE